MASVTAVAGESGRGGSERNGESGADADGVVVVASAGLVGGRSGNWSGGGRLMRHCSSWW